MVAKLLGRLAHWLVGWRVYGLVGVAWLIWLIVWFMTLSYLDPICKKLFYSSTFFLSLFYGVLDGRQCFFAELSLKRFTYCFANFNHSLETHTSSKCDIVYLNSTSRSLKFRTFPIEERLSILTPGIAHSLQSHRWMATNSRTCLPARWKNPPSSFFIHLR